MVAGAALLFSASLWAAPQITTFSPHNLSESINQIRAVFSEKVITSAAKDSADVFEVTCQPQFAGRARWENENTWVYTFVTNLPFNRVPGGTKCSVTLREEFKRNKRVEGKTAYNFQVDGPNILVMEPGSAMGNAEETVSEDQIFLLGLDANVVEDSVLRNLYFEVWGTQTRVEARVLNEAEMAVIKRASNFSRYQFPENRPLIMVQPKTNFPANKKIKLVWGRGITSREGGMARQTEVRIPLISRSELMAKITCERENARAGCSPFSEVTVEFSAPVRAEQALQIRLSGPQGWTAAPVVDGNNKGDSYLTSVTFAPTYKENASLTLTMPPDVRDDAGRPLANQASFPLKVEVAEFPPLAKFAANFGLLESQVTPRVLPVTIRSLNAADGKAGVASEVSGQTLRLGADRFAQITQWMRKIENRSNDERMLKNRDVSLLAGAPTTKLKLPTQNLRDFQVVGLPLAQTGFHIVELQSRVLAKSLLGSDTKPMYVPAAALVTNMVIHTKWGRDSSVFWVTALDSGLPVSNARVSLVDCQGKTFWRAQTDKNGLARYEGELKTRLENLKCRADDSYSRFDGGFFAFAENAGDFTFTHTSWTEGINPYQFGNLDYSTIDSPLWSESRQLAHTVLDRTLFRAGEQVGMKHFLRDPSAQGFKLINPKRRPNQVEVLHEASETSYVMPVTWDANGTAVGSFTIPKDAKLGLYKINLVKNENRNREVTTTSTFNVLEFKIPLMKGSIEFTRKLNDLVQPGQLEAVLGLNYQDGGPASNERAVFRYTVEKDSSMHFADQGELRFATPRVVAKNARTDEQSASRETVEQPLRLNSKGTATATITGLSGLDSGRTVMAQMEFTDKNGETQNLSRSLRVFPSGRLVAVESDSYGRASRKVQFKATVVDTSGRGVAGVAPEFEVFERIVKTHRPRMVGGYYESESVETITKVTAPVTCRGQTDRRGRLSCEAEVPSSGYFIIQAQVADAKGNLSYGSHTVYVSGLNRAWYPPANNDRMDLFPQKKSYDPGETASLEVQMPFAEASVLVTVEREGVLKSFVQRVSTRDPHVQVPIEAGFAPNIYVSALAVRGRISEPGAEPTATVDLGKPAFKLGYAPLNVNWKQNALTVKVEPARKVYKPRQTAQVTVKVLTPDGKPLPNTEFALAVVDEGLLQIAPNRTWDLLRAMMGRRQLVVETATAQMQVIGKRHYGMKAKPVGGDGGLAPTRELFNTLVYWNPRLKVGRNGEAVVTFPIQNDSLTGYRVVAIASSGLDRFGTGENSFITQQEIQVIPSLGQISRNGDELAAEFTLRNTTKEPRKLTVLGTVAFEGSQPQEAKGIGLREVKLGATGAELVTLGNVYIPAAGVTKAVYTVFVKNEVGQVIDRIVIRQDVRPQVYPRIWSASLQQLTGGTLPVPVSVPGESLRNTGGIKVALLPSLGGQLTTVNSTMERYPFTNMESLVSKAVVTEAKPDWDLAMSKLPAHLDGEGFVKYFPSGSLLSGSDVLTAYILSIANYAGLVIPDAVQAKMLSALTAFVEGRSNVGREATELDRYVRRVNALEVLARYGLAKPAHLTSLPKVASTQLPTSTLVDLVSLYTSLRNEAESQSAQETIRGRLTQTGTGMTLSGTGIATPTYLMTSDSRDQLELILVLTNHLKAQWSNELPLLVRGSVNQLRGRGCWDLTVANAVGSLAMKAFSREFEQGPVAGITIASLRQDKLSFDWNTAGGRSGGTLNFRVPITGDHTMDLTHQGSGVPWALVSSELALLNAPKAERGIALEKTLTPQKSVYAVGDVVTVTIKIKPDADMGFVSLVDPIPAGAKILGTEAVNGGGAWPDAEEMSYESYKATYSYVRGAGIELAYKVQVNNAGTFALPSTRVEALYAPENFADVPNAEWKVQRQ